MLDIEGAIKYPTHDPNWIVKVAVGSILSLIPIINLFSFGYILEVMRQADKVQDRLPEWENWGSLFKNGLAMLAVSIIYSLIPIIMTFWAIQILVAELYNYEQIISVGLILFLLLLATVIISVVAFIFPMVYAQYMFQRSIRASFKLVEACSRVKSVLGDYTISHALFFGLLTISMILLIIPVLGILCWLFGSFYLSIVFAHFFGVLYNRSELVAEGNRFDEPI